MASLFSANLNKSLRKELGKRSIGLRKGDKVKVMRGEHAGKEGRVIGVYREKGRATIEGISRKKSDGTEKSIGINVSNLQITAIESKDEKRIKGKSAGKKDVKKTAKEFPKKVTPAETLQTKAVAKEKGLVN